MGAAIPHLVTLSTSLPSILPHSADEIHTEIQTGTVEVQDEVIPDDDEDEDISYRTRGKSTVSVVIKVGDGTEDAPVAPPNPKSGARKNNTGRKAGPSGGKPTAQQSGQKGHKPQAQVPEQIVFREDEMDET